MSKKIISFSGKKGSGKSTAAQMFIKRHHFQELTFAHPIKDGLSKAFNLPLSNFESQKWKDAIFVNPKIITKEHITDFLDVINRDYYTIPIDKTLQCFQFVGTEYESYRQLIQFFGTEMGRQTIHSDIWIDTLKDRVDRSSSKKIVISDTRFGDERGLIKELKGTLFFIIRSDQEENDFHISENSYGKEEDYDVCICNDSDINKLYSELDLWYSMSWRVK